MDKTKKSLKFYMPTQRRLIQLYAALLYNAHAKGYITGSIYTGAVKNLCVPGLNCYSCPGAIASCPLGALQNALAASGSRAPAYVLGILLLYGLTFGRTICGFLCPMGLMQDLLHKIPTVKVEKNSVTRLLSHLKYGILAVFVILIPLWYALQRYPVPAFCKYICPAGTFGGAIGLLSNPVNYDKFSMLGSLFTWKFLVLLVVVGCCIIIYRAFCRFLCPLGAIYGLFAKVCVIGVKVEKPKCIDCGLCVKKCPMDIRHVGDHECIHCGKCMDGCPTGAISYKAGKRTLHGPSTESDPARRRSVHRIRITAWALALLVLAGALWFFNQPEPAAGTAEAAPGETVQADPAQQETVPVGYEVGMQAPDFAAVKYGGEGETFRLADHRGKTVIINFWATWCSPCCKELPYFDALYRNFGDEVEVVAIHSNLVTDDVQGYLDQFDYQLPFALDETGSVLTAYNGSTMLPHTVVVDANGIITYNQVGSVTYEQLEKLLEDARTEKSCSS